MNRNLPSLLLAVAALTAQAGAQSDEWFDRLGESLTTASADGATRARVTGSLEVDGYYTPEPRADMRFSERDFLVSPRLCLSLDAQAGERFYLFGQARIDRGFDPADQSIEARIDELALRASLVSGGRLNLQLGKFATVVGAWAPRHHAWENPFVTAPLVFDGLTPMWDRRPVVSVPQVLRRGHVEPNSPPSAVAADKHERLPIVWGPAYATGGAVAGTLGRLDYAFELKNAAPCSRPGSWEPDEHPWGPPALGARLGWRPSVMWNLGVSASRGTYLNAEGADFAQPGTSAEDHRQDIFAADASFAHRHLQVWAEVYASRFTSPGVEDLDVLGYYVEAKYKFSPMLFGAIRWNQLTYASIDDPAGGTIRWGRDTCRLDLALIRRLNSHIEVKLQYSPQYEDPAPDELAHAFAAQFVARF